MHSYLDSSVLLSKLLNQAPQLSQAEWNGITAPFASELIRIETRRIIERMKIENHDSEEHFTKTLAQLDRLFSGITLVPLQPRILARAAQPFGLIVGTLDALHLSTALALRDQDPAASSWTFFTHDQQLKRAATAVGFSAVG